MKKTIFTLLVASFFLAGAASAQMGMTNNYGQNNAAAVQSNQTVGQASAIDAVLQDIYKSQNISDQSKISCAVVTDGQFEKLGDAVMGYGITEAQHTAMENMMGGEGSATLKQAHINIGRSYIGCWASYDSGPSLMPMMGYYSGSSTEAAHGQARTYGFQGEMMGGYSAHAGYFWFCGVTLALVWIFLILSIVALIRWLRKNK